MAKPIILFLDDNPDRHHQIDQKYSGCDVVHCYTVDQFVDCLNNDSFDHFDMISLDHDLNDFDSHSTNFDGQEATGMDACGLMVNKKFSLKLPDVIHIHSVNPCGAQNMRSFLQGRGFSVRWIPFSSVQDDD
jgi:hypothetical protein